MNGSHFSDVLGNGPVLLAVVHVHGKNHATEQTAVALENGADGVFLINHGFSMNQELIEIYEFVRKNNPGAWIGVNFLDADPARSVSLLPDDVNGLWTDRSGVDDNMAMARDVKHEFTRAGYRGLYFGGVAFKYQKQPVDVAAAARAACEYMDVVTTSGPGTGKPPDVARVRDMAMSVHSTGGKIAVASGITSGNVEDYPFIDCFLVATGISIDFYRFDPGLVRELARKIHG